jgi:hypothetical protein
MSSRNRSLMAIAMLVVICMPLSLFLYWKVQQLILRHEMKEKLEQSNLVTIEIPAASVQWYEDDEEIVVQGRLFDIKSYYARPGRDVMIFTGLFDDEETELKKKVDIMLENQQQEAEEADLFITCFLFSFYSGYHSPDAGKVVDHMKSIRPANDGKMPQVYLSLICPPPKV